ncbi:CGNR zinc finger domain-containing protein [Streptomyces sp. NPDC051561]|uniref:CGNR zinc finger domain-containing protein n=1 Tax=Streptomyces sp. NPDC051561 TaxID=3365658 RepID=UPI00379FBD9F
MSNRLPLVGEPLPLDLVNTRVGGPAGEVDLLDSEEQLHHWLNAQAGRLTGPPPGSDGPGLDALRALRGRISTVIDCVRHNAEPPAQALRALTRAQLAAPLHRRLAWDGEAVTGTRVRSGSVTDVLLAELADATVDLLTDPVALGRLRHCEGPGCRLLFLAVNPRRRWCSPALCGNRVRVGRYYQRHKGEPA